MADPGNHSESSGSELSAAEFSPAEFSPAELDRLEDALEHWTSASFEDVPEASELAPHLRARLEDYRGLLTMVRDELPMEDVPDSLLAGVFAEAHATARPQTRPVTRRELVPAGPGLWERLRRSLLLPGFALAGSAALLLWVVQPAEQASLTDDTVIAEAATAQTPARLAHDGSPAPAAADAPKLEQRGSPESEAVADSVADRKQDNDDKAAALGGSPAAAAPPMPAQAPSDALAEPDPKDMPKPGAKKSSKKALEALEPIETYPGLDDVPAAEGVDKEALRDTLDTADAARRKGGCSEAMSLYVDAMGMRGADSERARARAGYGLCLATQGDDEKADKYFDAARALSPAIDGWIKRERGDGPSRKAPAKPSAKAKMEAPLDL